MRENSKRVFPHLFFYLFAWKRRRRAAWARDISTADETAPIVPWPATYEEGAHDETEHPGPGNHDRGSRPRGEAGGGESRAERDQQRVRQLRSQPDEKEHERLDVPRRQRQGGHRGQHRRSTTAEPGRLHGHPDSHGSAENHADERSGRRIDACAAARQRLSGTGRGGGGEAASADRAGVRPVGGHAGMRRGANGQLLSAPAACLFELPDERRHHRPAAHETSGRATV